MRFALLVCLAATPALADRATVTGTATFSIGALDVGKTDGFGPGGHFDLGASYGDVRVQGKFDIGAWFDEAAKPEAQNGGSYKRLGGALRYYIANLDVSRSRMRMFGEAGIGHHWIHADVTNASRADVAFGFGMAQEAHVGPTVVGGYFALRVLVTSSQPDDRAAWIGMACRGSCPEAQAPRPYDVGLFFIMGGVIGR